MDEVNNKNTCTYTQHEIPGAPETLTNKGDDIPGAPEISTNKGDDILGASEISTNKGDDIPDAPEISTNKGDDIPGAPEISTNNGDGVHGVHETLTNKGEDIPGAPEIPTNKGDDIPGASEISTNKGDNIPGAPEISTNKGDDIPGAPEIPTNKGDGIPGAPEISTNKGDGMLEMTTQLQEQEINGHSLGERKASVTGKKHSYQQLHGTSTCAAHKGDHEEAQLKGSLLEHRHADTVNAEVTQPLGPLKSSPEGDDVCPCPTNDIGSNNSEETRRSVEDTRSPIENGTDGKHCNVVVTQPSTLTSAPTGVLLSTQIEKKPKPKLQRRKSLNPRMMTPPGLEILDNKAMVAIRQQIQMDIQGGCGVGNTYKIWDVDDDQIFFATEDASCVCRWMCGPGRQFSLDVFSTQDDQVLNFHRTCCRCDCCCCLDCCLCLQKLYVVDCLGRTLGAVKQKFSVFNAKFDIVDHDNNVLFKVLGPCCPCRCSTELYFQVLNKTGERQIGRIQKKWGGDRIDNFNVDHEYFDVTFPPKLDSVDKALILGAAFLVNIMYMEMS